MAIDVYASAKKKEGCVDKNRLLSLSSTSQVYCLESRCVSLTLTLDRDPDEGGESCSESKRKALEPIRLLCPLDFLHHPIHSHSIPSFFYKFSNILFTRLWALEVYDFLLDGGRYIEVYGRGIQSNRAGAFEPIVVECNRMK